MKIEIFAICAIGLGLFGIILIILKFMAWIIGLNEFRPVIPVRDVEKKT